MQKWVGASSAGAVLDVSEWGTVMPEVRQRIGIEYLLPPPRPAKGGWGDSQAALLPVALPLGLPISADSHHEDEQQQAAGLEQPYGHLSIDTVTVAGELPHCCPKCGGGEPCCSPEQQQESPEATAEGGACHGFRPDGTNRGQISEHFFPGTGGGPLPCCSGSWTESPLWEADPAVVQAGGFLGRRAVGKGEPFGLCPAACETLWGAPPFCLSCPQAEEAPFCRELLSPKSDAEGNPGNGLDLDTIDSGFAECECRSPVHSECQGRQAGCDCVGAADEKEAFLASYVKQWVSCQKLKA